jgi:hypothetical protein
MSVVPPIPDPLEQTYVVVTEVVVGLPVSDRARLVAPRNAEHDEAAAA